MESPNKKNCSCIAGCAQCQTYLTVPRHGISHSPCSMEYPTRCRSLGVVESITRVCRAQELSGGLSIRLCNLYGMQSKESTLCLYLIFDKTMETDKLQNGTTTLRSVRLISSEVVRFAWSGSGVYVMQLRCHWSAASHAPFLVFGANV